MPRFIEDKDGDYIQVVAEQEGALSGVTLSATMGNADGDGSTHHTTVGPVDPHALIEAIKAECELHEDDEVHDEEPETYVHTTPATAEEPRLWAGADEPLIDGLIGRVADLEDEKERTEAHQHLAEHWNRRLGVVRTALSMLPAPGKRGGVMAAFAGEETPDPLRVENALKIARFAADEDRDIPGVDR